MGAGKRSSWDLSEAEQALHSPDNIAVTQLLWQAGPWTLETPELVASLTESLWDIILDPKTSPTMSPPILVCSQLQSTATTDPSLPERPAATQENVAKC